MSDKIIPKIHIISSQVQQPTKKKTKNKTNKNKNNPNNKKKVPSW